MAAKPPPSFLFSKSSVGGFGRPTSRYFSDAVHYFGRAPCEDKGYLHPAVLSWSKLGLRVADIGHVASRSCGVDQQIFVLLATKDRRWHTERGLHVGDRLARLQRLYPHATQRARSGWHLGAGLGANIVNGRVQTLILGGENVSEMPGGERITNTVDDWLPGGIYADAVYS